MGFHFYGFYYAFLLLTLQVKYNAKHRISHPEVSCKKGVLKNFAKFTGKHLCWSLI